MRKFLSGLILSVAALSSSAVVAGDFALQTQAPMSLIQYNSRAGQSDNDRDRPRRPQRYVCVVQPAESENRNRPHVCRTDEGRVGGRCRCSGVVGNGSRDLDD